MSRNLMSLVQLLWEKEEEQEKPVGPPTKDIVLVNDGSFNPVHKGHVMVTVAAKQAAIKLGYNVVAVYMLPKHSSWLERKFSGKDEEIIPDEKRIEFLLDATKNHSDIIVDTWEMEGSGYKDAAAMKAHYEEVHPNATYVMIVGEDYGECTPMPCFELENGSWQLRLHRTDNLSSTLIRKLGKEKEVSDLFFPSVAKYYIDKPKTLNEMYINVERWKKLVGIKE
jgi:nicotinic acid mononucleotide adenylyltransferase